MQWTTRNAPLGITQQIIAIAFDARLGYLLSIATLYPEVLTRIQDDQPITVA